VSDVARIQLRVDDLVRVIYVKIQRPRDTEPLAATQEKTSKDFDTLCRLDRAFQGTPQFGVVHPIACFPEHLAIVTEEAEGTNLHHLIRRNATVWRGAEAAVTLAANCQAAGRWLRHFQGLTTQETRSRFPAALVTTRLSADLDICERLGLPAAVATRILRYCQERFERAAGEPARVVGVHPDYQPDNVLVTERRVTVLDFARFHYGSASGDVGRFLASLEFFSRTPLYPSDRMRGLTTAFLQGYGWSTSDDRALLCACTVRHFARIARGVASWSTWGPLRRLSRWSTLRFVAGWERRLQRISEGLDELERPRFATGGLQ
jgi:hypothetical protein